MSDTFFLNTAVQSTVLNNSEYVFDRSEYVKKLLSEEVKCIILSTYSFNIESTRLELPGLFGLESKLPTLVLHGDRRKLVAEACCALEMNRQLKRIQLETKKESLRNFPTQHVSVKGEWTDSGKTRSSMPKSETTLSDDILQISVSDQLEGHIRNKDIIDYSYNVQIERVLPQWLFQDEKSSTENVTYSSSSSSSSSKNSISRNSNNSIGRKSNFSNAYGIPDFLKDTDLNADQNSKLQEFDEKISHLGSTPSQMNTEMRSDVEECSDRNVPQNNPQKVPRTVPNKRGRIGGYVMGVHHPKYILAFTAKGLHVVIR